MVSIGRVQWFELGHGQGVGNIFIIFQTSLAIFSHEGKKIPGRQGRWLKPRPGLHWWPCGLLRKPCTAVHAHRRRSSSYTYNFQSQLDVCTETDQCFLPLHGRLHSRRACNGHRRGGRLYRDTTGSTNWCMRSMECYMAAIRFGRYKVVQEDWSGNPWPGGWTGQTTTVGGPCKSWQAA